MYSDPKRNAYATSARFAQIGLNVPKTESLLADLASRISASTEFSTVPSKVWIYKGRVVVIDLSHVEERFAFDLMYEDAVLTMSVLGRTDAARRVLRNALIGSYEMDRSSGERHHLGVISSGSEQITTVRDKILGVKQLIDKQILAAKSPDGLDADCINVYWWDGKPNFGDVIGPWLVSKISKRNPVNGRTSKRSAPPIMAVGSILNMLEQDGSIVWGSGLMNNLSVPVATRLRSLSEVSVRAVRGKLTRAELILKLGWDVPEVYGDPALLLPRFFPVVRRGADRNKIAVLPHYVHVNHFKHMGSESLNIVDVQDGMERVIRQIASASVCISTSLHGLIIAQAYGVPWVWVRVTDNQLGGDTFKFRDFFSTLDSSAVSSLDVAKEDIGKLDLDAIAQTACLPELQISLDDLLASFPHPAERQIAGTDNGTSGSGTLHIAEEESRDELTIAIAGLMSKMDTISGELAEQRQLLQKLAGQR